MSIVAEPSDAFPDRVEVFRACEAARRTTEASLALVCVLFAGILLLAYANNRLELRIIAFLLPLALLLGTGPAISLAYIRTVRVTIDHDSFHKSSPFGRISFPLTAIINLDWQSNRNGRFLSIDVGAREVHCSVSVFGNPQLDRMQAVLTKRAQANGGAGWVAAGRPTPGLTVDQVVIGIAILHLFIIVAFINLIGLNTRFVPTPLGGAIMTGAIIAVGLVTTGLTFWRIHPWTAPPTNPEVKVSPGQLWAGALLISLMFGMLTAAFSGGVINLLASWYTDLTGAITERVVTVSGYSPGYRSCAAYRVVGITPMGPAFCAGDSHPALHPTGSKLVLIGPTSALGSDIEPIDKTNP